MPLVRIDLAEGKSTDYRHTIGRVIYDSLTAIGAPANDRFQVITEHRIENLVITADYLGITHTADCIIVQITLVEGRSTAVKQTLFKSIADGLHEKLSLRREDVIINLVEVNRENWSFGNGIAQYALTGNAQD